MYYLHPVNLKGVSHVLVGNDEINQWPWLNYGRSRPICTSTRKKLHQMSKDGDFQHTEKNSSLPMFKDSPPWVARKLEWKPLHPRTPPPKSVKFLGLS